jgi:large subunit ribosomal protein L9
VNPDHVCTACNRDGVNRQSALQPLACWKVENLPEERLPRRPHQYRRTEIGQAVDVAEKLEVVRQPLSESDAGIEDDPVPRNPGGLRRRDPLCKEAAHVLHDILVLGLLLHSGRRSLHVHQDDVRTTRRDDRGHRRVEPKRADVVHEGRSCVQGCGGHRSLDGVDRKEDVAPYADTFEDRDDAFRLHVRGHRRGPRPTRLAPHIDDVGALGLHLQGSLDGRSHREAPASLEKGIWRGVQDSHHEHAASPLDPPFQVQHLQEYIRTARSEAQFDAVSRPFYNHATIERYGVMIIAKVLLTTTIDKVGHVGEVVNVASGFARNYLFPRGLAIEPSEHNIARFVKERAVHEAELVQRAEKAQQLKAKIADQTLVFTRKAHGDGRLYGSVRAEDIAAQIEEKVGERIETSRIRMDGAIETVGPHAVTVSLYKDITVDVRIRVDEEGKKEE